MHACLTSAAPAQPPRVPIHPVSLLPHIQPAAEDWFFRTVHLGTDCWAFVALARLASARQLADGGRWHVAASRAMQVRQGNLCMEAGSHHRLACGRGHIAWVA